MAVKNYGMGRVRRADVGNLLKVGGPVRIDLCLGDVGDKPSHRQDAGGIPPQVGPLTDGEETI